MKKKKENEVRQHLQQALDLLDKKASAIEIISKITVAANVAINEELESRKREVTENMKRMGISKDADKGQFMLFSRLSDVIVLRTLLQDIMTQVEQDSTKPK